MQLYRVVRGFPRTILLRKINNILLMKGAQENAGKEGVELCEIKHLQGMQDFSVHFKDEIVKEE